MKLLKYTVLIAFVAFAMTDCEKMEDTYAQYLDDEKVYSPRIRNLEKKTGLKELTLFWDNPQGDIAKKIFIDYQDSTITTESMIDSILLSNLEIKGYIISVYTMDAFDNLSVPSTVTAFPNGEDEN